MNDIALVLQVVTLVFWFMAALSLAPSKVNWWYAGWFTLLLSLMLGGIALHTLR